MEKIGQNLPSSLMKMRILLEWLKIELCDVDKNSRHDEILGTKEVASTGIPNTDV